MFLLFLQDLASYEADTSSISFQIAIIDHFWHSLFQEVLFDLIFLGIAQTVSIYNAEERQQLGCVPRCGDEVFLHHYKKQQHRAKPNYSYNVNSILD